LDDGPAQELSILLDDGIKLILCFPDTGPFCYTLKVLIDIPSTVPEADYSGLNFILFALLKSNDRPSKLITHLIQQSNASYRAASIMSSSEKTMEGDVFYWP
jgi:hypothetical protein